MEIFLYWLKIYGETSLGIGIVVASLTLLFLWLIDQMDREDRFSLRFKLSVPVLVGVASTLTWPLVIVGILAIALVFVVIFWLTNLPSRKLP